MRFLFSFLVCFALVAISCQDEQKSHSEKQTKETKRNELVFNSLEKDWVFTTQPVNESSKKMIGVWSQWRDFINELSLKPKSSISAFQKKAQTLSGKVKALERNIPIDYDLPEIRSRISVIQTKVNMVNLYLQLNNIPERKITDLVKEINTSLVSFQNQLEEVDRKSKIQLEEGESDMLLMLDTTRAIPNSGQSKPVQPSEQQKKSQEITPEKKKRFVPFFNRMQQRRIFNKK